MDKTEERERLETSAEAMTYAAKMKANKRLINRMSDMETLVTIMTETATALAGVMYPESPQGAEKERVLEEADATTVLVLKALGQPLVLDDTAADVMHANFTPAMVVGMYSSVVIAVTAVRNKMLAELTG